MPELGLYGDAKFRAVSTPPSFEKTPVGPSTPPIPYPVTQDLSNLMQPVRSVRINGSPVYVLKQSYQPTLIGDQAGVAMGVKSSTTQDRIEPILGSMTVKADKKSLIRVNDPCFMVSKNTVGRYIACPSPAGAIAPGGGMGASANPPAKPETPEEKAFQEAVPSQMGPEHTPQAVPGLGALPTLGMPMGLSGAAGERAAAAQTPPGTPGSPDAQASNHFPTAALPPTQHGGTRHG